MIDTDMIASPNFARLVYDGDGSTFGEDVSGPAGSGKIEEVLARYWTERGLRASRSRSTGARTTSASSTAASRPAACSPAPRRRRPPRRSPGTAASQGEQLDPCYHEACDNYATVTGQPPAETMNVYENDPTPANLVIAQQQANSLRRQRAALAGAVQGHARARHLVLRALEGRFGPRATATAKQAKAHRVKARGHKHALTR